MISYAICVTPDYPNNVVLGSFIRYDKSVVYGKISTFGL